MKTKRIVIFGLGQRGTIYATFARTYPELFELVAIIENDAQRVAFAHEQFPGVPVFTNYHDFLEQKIQADILAVSTQDKQHREHAIAMMEAGYDLLLEKPIAPTKEECLAVYEASVRTGQQVIICHVLRNTPFYSAVKRILDSGRLGDVVTIHASENVGYYHYAHSFVRGPWRNSASSSPIILAKCCHDMDIIRYLMGEECLSVASYGGLHYFNPEHAPQEATQYCTDCPHEDCVFKAQSIYTSEQGDFFANYFTTKEHTRENVLGALKHSAYDRCVFACDNDVADHQVTIMQFANGKPATHTMSAFSKDIYRDIKIHGTKAELVGVVEKNEVEIRTYGGETEVIPIDISAVNVGGHMGGDFFMMHSLYRELNGEVAEGITYLDVSVESHLMSFGAEESRNNNGAYVRIKEGTSVD